jgi:hypothetical protein
MSDDAARQYDSEARLTLSTIRASLPVLRTPPTAAEPSRSRRGVVSPPFPDREDEPVGGTSVCEEVDGIVRCK